MLSLFLFFRAAVFAFFIICNAIICSVAAWNLSFAQETTRVASVDGFLIFVGALGIVVIFPVIFIEVLRKGAVASKVWFEVLWLTFFWVLNFVGAVSATAIVSHDFCGFPSADVHLAGSACTSAKILVVFAWLNSAFVLMYLLLLTIFSILHQEEDQQVWKSSVCEFPWFATKHCIRSIPNSPVMRYSRAKYPSLVIPKPFRPAPQLVFNHGRAGLGSQVEIEHFTDIVSSEGHSIHPPYSDLGEGGFKSFATSALVTVPVPAATTLYPSYVQRVETDENYRDHGANNTYYMNRASGSSPPPIRNWPRPIASTLNSTSNMNINPRVDNTVIVPPATDSPRPLSQRALQKQRAAPQPPSRTSSNGSTNSQKSLSERRRRSPLPPLDLGRLISKKPVKVIPIQTNYEDTPNDVQVKREEMGNRSRPTGPRTRSTSSGYTRSRPPPLDLTIKGSTPNNRR